MTVMDETTFYRLHIDFDAASGYKFHQVRPVDTYADAEQIAQLGHERDQDDGGVTVYTLWTWEQGPDRATCTQRIVLEA